MKKCCFFLLLPMLLFSCTNDFDESNEIKQEQPNVISNMTTNSVSINLSQIVTQLVATYPSVNGSNSYNTLSEKIILLKNVSSDNANFAEIASDFSVPTEEEAKKFLVNYDQEYCDLKISSKVKNYFNSILELEYDPDLSDMLYSIITDDQLTSNEKNLLIFTVDCLNDHNGNGDPNWKKRMIVASTSGFEVSSANAVFNVTLLNIIHMKL